MTEATKNLLEQYKRIAGVAVPLLLGAMWWLYTDLDEKTEELKASKVEVAVYNEWKTATSEKLAELTTNLNGTLDMVTWLGTDTPAPRPRPRSGTRTPHR